MTPEALTELNRKIAVMQAYRDGKFIETCPHNEEAWCNTDWPGWDWLRRDYRVKPVEPRIIFVHTNCDGSVSTRHTSECPPFPSIPFVEMTLTVREKLNL